MRYIAIFAILFFTTTASADELRTKIGWSDVQCAAIESHVTLDASYEFRNKWVGLEVGCMYQLHKLRQVGWLNIFDPYVLGKVYLPYDIYAGAGPGYLITMVAENYDLESDCDNEVGYHFVLGKEFGDWFVEAKVIIADLDIETSLPYETDVEKHSRLSSINLELGYKW